MRDQIIDAYVKGFAEEHALTGLGEPELFEHFVNHSIVSKHHPEAFDVDDVSVGGNGDLGVDGLAILVNDRLVTSPEEVDHLKKELRRLNVKFIFIQSKTSQHFDGKDIVSFIQGVRRFFERSFPAEANESLSSLFALKEHFYQASIDMEDRPL